MLTIRMLSSDCTDTHADLDLPCPQIAQGPLLYIAHQCSKKASAMLHVTCYIAAHEQQDCKTDVDVFLPSKGYLFSESIFTTAGA